jgi:hypothetical protein
MKTFKSTIILALSIVALLSANISSVTAQEDGEKKVEFGLRFMPTLSSFQMKNSAGSSVTTKGIVGLGVGGFLGYNFSQNIGIQAEVIYNSISQKHTETNVEQKVNLRYVNIPLLLSLNTGKYKLVNLNIVAGPQIGISAGSTLFTSGTSNNDAVLAVKKGDLGFAYGGGFDIGLMRNFRLGLGFRGVYGLFDISDNSATLVSNNYYILDKAHVKTYSGYVGLSYLFL